MLGLRIVFIHWKVRKAVRAVPCWRKNLDEDN